MGFGKMGVLKAREKKVDLEINGEAVEIQMKLDDSGVAYFMEDIETEGECFLDETETSPVFDDGVSYGELKTTDPAPWDYITLLEDISTKQLESEDTRKNLPKLCKKT